MALIVVNSFSDSAVDHSDDATNLTLRDAIDLANAKVNADTIVFDASLAGQTIRLTSGVLTITSGTASINGDTNGDGNPDIVLEGVDDSHFVIDEDSTLSLQSLALNNGYVSYGYNEGGSITNHGTLSIAYCDFSGNYAVGAYGHNGSGYDAAGAIFNHGILNITQSTLTGGTARGGYGPDDSVFDGYEGGRAASGIVNLGTLTVSHTVIQGGTAVGGHGGVGDFALGYDGGKGGNAAHGILNLGTITSGSGVENRSPGFITGGAGGAGGPGDPGYSDGDRGAAGYGYSGNGGYLHNLDTETNNGTSGADTVSVSDYSSFYGLKGNDVIMAGRNTVAYGGTGNDTIIIAFVGRGTFNGGFGSDTLDVSGDSFDLQTFDLSAPNFQLFAGGAYEATFFGFENIIGSQGSDIIIGSAFANILSGSGGDDNLRGGAGADVLNGGTGVHDIADYTRSNAAVVVSLTGAGSASGGHAQGDTLTGIEDLTGSSHGDTLTGSAGANVLLGAGGNDTLRGGAGADELNGGGGAHDVADYKGSNSAVLVSLAGTTPEKGGHAAGDVLVGIEDITGSTHDDSLTGNSLANTLSGGSGADTLNGGAGADTLNGGAGVDRLTGSTGNDTLNGGGDADIFIFNIATLWNKDSISGWQNGHDKIDLRGAGFDFGDFTETQVGADTLLTLTANTSHSIRLIGINATTIDAADFM